MPSRASSASLAASASASDGGAAVILTDSKYGSAFFEHRYLSLLDEHSRQHVLNNLDSLVVKSRAGSGGFGVAIGPELSAGQLATVREQVTNHPEAYIGQEIVNFSTHFVFDDASDGLVERHIDLRVFSVQNGDGTVTGR